MRSILKSVAFVFGTTLPIVAAEPSIDDLPPMPEMQILETPTGFRFALFGERPTEPAPTLFLFASSLEAMQKNVAFLETGRRLSKHGFLFIGIDPPCHGTDAKPGEPPELRGWRYRVEQGESLMAPFVDRTRKVLDHLVQNQYADPERIFASGTSRGGYCALSFAAAEPRVRAVTCISPVTDLGALSEFRGLEKHPATEALSALHLADALAGRPVWISIGNHDLRVGTDAAIAFARTLTSQGVVKSDERTPVMPVELIVGPSPGHGPIAGAYRLAAEWLLRQSEKTK